MDILEQSALVVALTSFALGFSLLARNVKNKLYIAFAATCTVIFAWALTFALHRLFGQPGFYSLHLFFNVWMAPAGLLFAQIMARIEDSFSRRLFWFSILTGMAATLALFFGLEDELWIRPVILFSPMLVILQVLYLMWIDRRIRRGLKRLPKLPTVGFTRRNLIYVGCILVLVMAVMDHVPKFGTVIPSIGNLLLTVYLFFMSQAISQQRLLNFGALFSRFMVLLVVSLTLTGVYSLLVAWIENRPGLFFLNSFVASFLIIMLLDPLRSLVRYFTHSLQTKKHLRLEQTLRETQLQLAGVTDPGVLFQSILATAQMTLKPDWAALFVLRSDGTKYRRVRTLGQESAANPAGSGGRPPVRELLANHPLVEHSLKQAARGELPILLDQIFEGEIDRLASRSLREQNQILLGGLKALGCNLLIPLIDAGQVIGFITLLVPGPPDPWGGNWGLLHVIYPFFQRAAQTLRSMEVYSRQREKERLAALGEMAAGLAHEIRNPLGAIKGAAQFLDPSQDRPESHFLKVIIEETDRLNRVVTQFLDYSKPSQVEAKIVNLGELAERTVARLRPSLDSRYTLTVEMIPDGLAMNSSGHILASAEQIQQVMINLIQNSYRALENRANGLVEVIVESDATTKEVLLTVEDNGIGIKRENLDKLFIPFFTTSPSGTGLGLSICQKIIEAHRGRIEVASEEGKFTRFTVILPQEKG